VMDTIMKPLVRGLQDEGITYKGVLYAGLMIDNGKPMVLEFNCRFGDPEAQPILSRLKSDLVEVSMAIVDQKLVDIAVEWKDDPAVCVVLASGGYPGNYEKGKGISGLEEVKKMDRVVVFHAGTAFDDGGIVSNGGRVLGVTATGQDIAAAKAHAYQAIDKIHFDGMHYRRDIADRALNR
jgi:phosphoribosylamine---glycine ligase